MKTEVSIKVSLCVCGGRKTETEKHRERESDKETHACVHAESRAAIRCLFYRSPPCSLATRSFTEPAARLVTNHPQ